MNLAFYDIEVFAYDSLVVFKDIDKNIIGKFWNNRDRQISEDASGFEGVLDIVKTHTLVGYNNYGYDDFIVTMMMNQYLSQQSFIKKQNDHIISGKKATVKVSNLIKSLDVMQQIDVSKPSLKQIEGNMGLSIVESKIDFNIGRPLTDEERLETERYCEYDVDSTIEVYKLRKQSYFNTKESLITMLPEDVQEKATRWNTTTISANILTSSHELRRWNKILVPERYWRNVEGIPTEVWDMWEECTTEEHILDKGNSKTLNMFDCSIVMGMGGLHGAPNKPCKYPRVKHKDVKSMYPSAICYLNGLGDATEIYDGIRKERIKIKHTDKTKATALKLILNSVYGLYKNEYSALFNPMASATVCIYGQIALFSLCRELHNAGYKIININTDGVVYAEDDRLGDTDEKICADWEKEFSGFELETDYFTNWIQKDVNNYIALEKDEVIVKGGEVNKYQTNKFFSNNNCRIVQIALVDKLLYGKDILTTIADHRDNPLLYQYILKAGGTYKGVCDSNRAFQQKVNRVFASKENVNYTKLYKVRMDDGLVNFPDMPDRMFIWNNDIRDLPVFDKIVDLDHYYQVASEKLKGWPRDVY